MPKVSLAFFTVAPIYVLIGMAGGIYMGASDDHSLAPAHAHLNLIGFVMMSIMGTFYALARDQYSVRLAWANFWLLNLGVVLMTPVPLLRDQGQPGAAARAAGFRRGGGGRGAPVRGQHRPGLAQKDLTGLA